MYSLEFFMVVSEISAAIRFRNNLLNLLPQRLVKSSRSQKMPRSAVGQVPQKNAHAIAVQYNNFSKLGEPEAKVSWPQSKKCRMPR
jgi:hypothetical protein